MRRALLALTILSACGDGASKPDAAVDPLGVEIGTGRLEFTPITGSETLELIRGPQGGDRLGGYHVWIAVKLIEVDPNDVSQIRVTVMNAGNKLQSEIARTPDVLEFEPCEGGVCAAGLAPRLVDCCAVAEQQVVLGVEITTTDGRRAIDAETTMIGACDAC